MGLDLLIKNGTVVDGTGKPRYQADAGFAADVVIFDEHTIKPSMPTVEKDLPGGSRRLVQKAEGIAATIVNGQLALEDGKATGNHAGQVLEGPLAG